MCQKCSHGTRGAPICSFTNEAEIVVGGHTYNIPKNDFLALKALSINDQVLLELTFQTITTLRTYPTKKLGLSPQLSVSPSLLKSQQINILIPKAIERMHQAVGCMICVAFKGGENALHK